MNSREQAAFEVLVSELNAALARLSEPPVRDNRAFSVEPDWLPEMLCVKAQRDAAADLRFTVEDTWARVDIAGFEEAIYMPLPGELSRAARKHPPMSETLTRLITSRVTVRYLRRKRELFMTDAAGHVWGNNKYYGGGFEIPQGFVEGEAREFAPLFPPRA